jgi:uncharacterized protein YbjT (DUF2867 family)
MSILVTTPTGNVGSRVTARLLEERADVRVFARSPEKLPDGVRAHAEVVPGDLEDPESLAQALDGASALFFVIPPNVQTDDWRAWQRQIAENAVDALPPTGCDRVVFLSSCGAPFEHVGPISGLGEAEQMLRASVPNVAALRAGYFMENFLQFMDSIVREQVIYHAFPPDVQWPMVATRDVGDVAARWLLDEDWSGHHVAGVHGPEDLSHSDAATAIGRGLDVDVTYQQVPLAAVKEQMREMGLPADVVHNYGEMIAGLTRIPRDEIEPRTEETTTPTTLEAFAQQAMKPAVEAMRQESGS